MVGGMKPVRLRRGYLRALGVQVPGGLPLLMPDLDVKLESSARLLERPQQEGSMLLTLEGRMTLLRGLLRHEGRRGPRLEVSRQRFRRGRGWLHGGRPRREGGKDGEASSGTNAEAGLDWPLASGEAVNP